MRSQKHQIEKILKTIELLSMAISKNAEPANCWDSGFIRGLEIGLKYGSSAKDINFFLEDYIKKYLINKSQDITEKTIGEIKTNEQ